MDFPGSLVVKNPPSNARDMSLTPGQGTKIPQEVQQNQKQSGKKIKIKAPQESLMCSPWWEPLTGVLRLEVHSELEEN